MRVLIYSPYSLNPPHFETQLEIAQRHILADDDVAMVGCNAQLAACDVNSNHSLVACVRCVGRRRAGLRALTRPVAELRLAGDPAGGLALVKPAWQPDRQDDGGLRHCRVGNFDLGYAVLSSLVSLTRDPKPDLLRWRRLIARFLQSSVWVYLSMKKLLQTWQPDLVYVYNGRYAPMRAALRACQACGVTCLTHEKASTINKYSLWKNTTIHDVSNITSEILKSWNEAFEPERTKAARAFYDDKVQGVSRTWISYTSGQDEHRLPDDWDDSLTNIVIFNSSEDECSSLGPEWENGIFETQNDGVQALVSRLREHPRFRIYLRVHPNLRGVDNSQTRNLRQLSSPNLVVLQAEDPTSTYQLIRSADVVLTFGSTMGVEATYHGRPSILVGPAIYSQLNVAYNVATLDEMVTLIRSSPPSKPVLGALQYGHFFQTYGIPFLHYRADGIYTGRFRGCRIEEPPSHRAAAMFLGHAEHVAAKIRNATRVIGN